MSSRLKTYDLTGSPTPDLELKLGFTGNGDLEVTCFNKLSNPSTFRYHMFGGNSDREIVFERVSPGGSKTAVRSLSGSAMKDAYTSGFHGLAYVTEHATTGDIIYKISVKNRKGTHSMDAKDEMKFTIY